MNEDDLKYRSKLFALRVIKLSENLPRTPTGKVIANQILRAGTSVGANYRAVCRARSSAEFASKLGIVIEEADECCYWLELIEEAKLMPASRISELKSEANELVAIFVASQKTIQNRKSKI